MLSTLFYLVERQIELKFVRMTEGFWQIDLARFRHADVRGRVAA